jgi:hypothetical protein
MYLIVGMVTIDFGSSLMVREFDEESFISLEPSESDESVYFNACEDICQSQVDNGKAPMFSSSHIISEHGSSSSVKPPDI